MRVIAGGLLHWWQYTYLMTQDGSLDNKDGFLLTKTTITCFITHVLCVILSIAGLSSKVLSIIPLIHFPAIPAIRFCLYCKKTSGLCRNEGRRGSEREKREILFTVLFTPLRELAAVPYIFQCVKQAVYIGIFHFIQGTPQGNWNLLRSTR